VRTHPVEALVLPLSFARLEFKVFPPFFRGVYSSITPPPPWGGGKESKGLRAREENQRRVEKMERQREKKRNDFVLSMLVYAPICFTVLLLGTGL
jgi:hypothetical protein